MNEDMWVCFDTETTGLLAPDNADLRAQPFVAEFALVGFTMNEQGEGEELAAASFLVKPPIPMPPETSKKHKIYDSDLAACPAFRDKADLIRTLFADADGRCGNHLVFDEMVLDCEFKRLDAAWRPTHPQQRACTIESSEWLLGRRPLLSRLHERLFGTKLTGAHEALTDVRATIRCVRALRGLGAL